jgi:DNA-nicking Smr family endonuclease
VRKLAPEEAELWAKVAATIRPLSRNPQSSPERRAEPPKAVEGVRSPAPRPLHHVASRRGPPPRSGEDLHRATLDGGWDRRLRSGSIVPDRTLDLHGHSLNHAWEAIDRALERSIAAGDRVLLLITGHERKGEPPLDRGRIRAAVHDWLAVSRHAPRIAAVRGAHPRHGGGGSLYIIIRKS